VIGGLAKGQKISTDCTIHGQVEGKTYCFGNQAAMDEFMKDPKGNLTKAEAYYSKP
jgi:YHS domain-containing protein